MRARSSVALVFGIALLASLVAVGLAAFTEQMVRGDVVTGMRGVGAGGAVWGLYVVMDGVLLGAGIAVMAGACLAQFSRDRDLEAVARLAMPVAIACFFGAGMCVLADQGRPLAALRALSLYARPQSPMFVTFTSVGAVCLFASLVQWLLSCRPDLAEAAKRPSVWRPLRRLLAAGYGGSAAERYRRQKSGFWMSLVMLPALLAPLTALAIVFVVRPARSLPLTLIEVGAFLLLSGAAGIGLLLGAAALAGRLTGRQAGFGAEGGARLGNALLLALSLALPTIVVAEIAGLASDDPALSAYARSLLSDSYGWFFWGAFAVLFSAAVLLWRAARRGRLTPRVTVAAGMLALLGAFLHHYLLLVAWQTHGLALPYAPGVYTPTRIECAVVLGILALCLLLLLPMVRLIPFAPLAFVGEPNSKPGKPADRRRTVVTWFWFLTGLAVAGVGLALSARAGTDAFQDPIFAGSPVVFILGLAMVATTGAVYELLPDSKP